MPPRVITAWQADYHAGHRLGLCPPDITVYDEDVCGHPAPRPVILTATQEMLWNAFTADVQSVVDLYQAGELAVGDFVLMLFVDGNENQPLATQKVYQSW